MDRIKRLSYEVLVEHKSKFGEDFADNKKVLDRVAIIRSKGLKNEIAGYITKFIKKEIREKKSKQSQNNVSKVDDHTLKEKNSEKEGVIQEIIELSSESETTEDTEVQ